MVGIGGFDLEKQIKFIKFCDKYDVDAFCWLTQYMQDRRTIYMV